MPHAHTSLVHVRRLAAAAVVVAVAAVLSLVVGGPARAIAPPADDYDLTATGGPGSITLHWSKGAGSTNHQVFEGTTPVGPLLGDVDTYTVTGLACGSYHTYQVSASNSAGPSSQWSNGAHATTDACGGGGGGTPPAAPTGLTATGGAGSIQLSWTASAGATGYRVYEGATQVGADLGAGTTTTVTGLACASTHTYAVVALNTAGASPQSAPATATTSTCGSNRSGLPWLSGGGIDVSIGEFERYRGRPMDTIDTWPNRGNWTELENPDIYGAISSSAGFAGRIVIATTMVPNDGVSTLDACAAGAYDAHLQAYGQKLVSLGRGDSIIRLGWEMNILGTGNDAQVPHGDYAGWIGCWRHWHDAVMSVPGAAFLWDFNPNGDTHYDAIASGNVESIYPGDAYVDLIGPDYYDQFPDITDDASWNAEYDATQGDVVNGIASPRGIGAWLWYATVFHHKLLSVPEWGISAGSDGSGDAKGAYFIGRLAQFFHDNASVVHDEEVFSIDGGVYGCAFTLDPSTCNPQSSAAYAASF